MNRNDQQFLAQRIRAQYVEKTPSELDALRTLDRKARRPLPHLRRKRATT